MTYHFISKYFRYFFQFFQLQVKSLWFSLSGIEPVHRNTTEKYLYSAHFIVVLPIHPISNFFYILSSFFHFRRKKPICSRTPSQFPSNNELVNSNIAVKYWYSAHICCCLFSFENYNFLQRKILPIHPFSNFLKMFTQFLTLQVEETYFFQEVIAVSGITWKEHVNSNTIIEYSYSAHFAVVSLVLRITASCKGNIYLIMHLTFFPVFSGFFHFRRKKPISSGTV